MLLSFENNVKIADVVITMDNAAIHHAKKEKTCLEKWRLDTLYIPLYSPILASVKKVFLQVKSVICVSDDYERINFDNKSGFGLVFKTYITLSKDKIIPLWSKLIDSPFEIIKI